MTNKQYQTELLSITQVTRPFEWQSLTHHFWQQTWEYGEVQQAHQRTVERYIIHHKITNAVLGYFQIIIYPGITTHTIGYLPHGPYVDVDTWETRMGTELTQCLTKIGKDHSCMFVRVEPQAELGIYNRSIEGLGTALPSFAYRSSFNQPRGEAVTYLDVDLEALKQGFSKSTKRNITRAEKNNLSCSFHYGKDMLKYTDEFITLNKENTQSHGTTTHTDTYFHSLFSVLSQNPDNFIAQVSHQGSVCASNLFTVWGEAGNKSSLCPFGASNATGKQLGAYYFIKWCALVEMHTKVQSFNWGGVALGYNDDNLQGVTTFKKGFESTTLDLGPLHDIIIAPIYYYLFLLRSFISSLRK